MGTRTMAWLSLRVTLDCSYAAHLSGPLALLNSCRLCSELLCRDCRSVHY